MAKIAVVKPSQDVTVQQMEAEQSEWEGGVVGRGFINTLHTHTQTQGRYIEPVRLCCGREVPSVVPISPDSSLPQCSLSVQALLTWMTSSSRLRQTVGGCVS